MGDRRRRTICEQRGQAQLELIAGIPVLIAAGLVAMQLLAVGYSQALADGAAEAGAIAVTDGREPVGAAVAALPGWAGGRVEVSAERGRIFVSLRPPSLLPGLGPHLAVESRASGRPSAAAR